MNRSLIALLAAVAAVIVGAAVVVAFWFSSRRATEEEMLRADLADARAEIAALRERVVPGPQPTVDPGLAATSSAGSDPEASAVEPSDAGAEESADAAAGSGSGSFAAMLGNPVMRDMIRQQSAAQLKVFYGDFLEKFGVDDELAQPVYDLLTERQMAMLDKSLVLMNGAATAEEKRAAREEIKETMEAYGEQFRDLLGDDAYAEFQLYEKSAGERMELNSLKQAMEGSGEPLSVEQEEQLMALMFEERTNFAFTNDFSDQTRAFENEFSPENFEIFVEEYARLQEAVRDRAGEVLTPAQQEIFAKNQENYRNMIKAGLEMQSRMFSGANAGGGN